MAVKVSKTAPDKLYLKMSHHDEFQPITLTSRVRSKSNHRRRSVSQLAAPERAYGERKGVPRLAKAKYDDLMKLTKGKRPLIRHPDHVSFYTNLPHESS
jgi:hypothetical protein